MMTPKVSICIPAYQQPQGLARALQSLLEQDFRDYEVIVTDDSADAAVEGVCHEYALRMPLRYFRNVPPQGTPENWNVAMRQACGEYIKILHHDDWFTHPQALGVFVDMLDGHPDIDFACSGCFNINRHGDLVNQRKLQPADIRRIQRQPSILFCANRIGAPSATIFRRKVGLFFDPQFKWIVDIDYYIRLLKPGQPLLYSPEPLVSVTVQSPQQVTSECENNKRIEIGEHLALYGKLLASGNAGLLVFNHMINLFLRFAIAGEQDVRACGYHGLIPTELKVYFVSHRLLQCVDWLLRRMDWAVRVFLAIILYVCARGRRFFRRSS